MTATISPATIVEPTPVLAASPEASPRPTMADLLPIGDSSDASNSRPAIGSATSNEGPPGGSNPPATSRPTQPGYGSSRGPDVPDPAASRRSVPISTSLLDPALCLAADVLDDLERVRIANENRVRQMTRSVEDSDGEVRGFGYDPTHRDVVKLAEIVANLTRLEHEATLELQRRLRKHALGAWVKATKGVGEKQGARLLAAIGDPYINSAKEAPRTVSALWAYCGLHVLPAGRGPDDTHGSTADRNKLPDGHTSAEAPFASAVGDQHRDTDHDLLGDHLHRVGVAAKRRKGERANWSTKAKMRAYLIAERCVVTIDTSCRDAGYPHNGWDGHLEDVTHIAAAVPAQDHPQDGGGLCGYGSPTGTAAPACGCSPYRVVYDGRRARTALTHPDWTPGHSHNDGLRIASKAILKDLWRAARDWHLTQESETTMTDPTPQPTRPVGPSPEPTPKAA